MASHLGKAITIATGLAFAAASAAVALASIPANAPEDGATVEVMRHTDEALLPAPVRGITLFVASAGETAPLCVTEDEVMRRLDAERQELGGETVMLADGLDQAFADIWRLYTNVKPVEVSAVLAHVVGEADAGVVDVIEIDVAGCAMSRTILNEADWRFLLVQAAGVEV